MKKLTVISICIAALCSSPTALAGDAEINWEKPEKFTDIRPANESRKRFRERTLAELEEFVVEQAQKYLPEGQVLKMNVTDLDLAGQVWPSSFIGFGNGVNDVRLVKRVYIPRIEFSYELVDTDGTQIKSAEVNLKDLSFQDRSNTFFKSENLRYEKNMLKHWFRDEFPELIAKN